MIPFDSWDGKTSPTDYTQVARLEKFFGPCAVVFNTSQNAVAAIMETLGSRTNAVPVVLPVTAAPDTIAGVLRGGGNPILLDIDPGTLQIAPEMLQMVLDEIETAVVVLTRPGGLQVDPRLVEMTKELPTILDTKLLPHEELVEEPATFVLYDFGTIAGDGALLIHRFKDQISDLRRVRSGVLGLAANMNALTAEKILKEYKSDLRASYDAFQRRAAEAYTKAFGRTWYTGIEWPYFIAAVDNADRVVAHLHSHGFEAMKPVFPLHFLSEMHMRWTEQPSYPVAEELCKKLVALPTHSGILFMIDDIVAKIQEVEG